MDQTENSEPWWDDDNLWFKLHKDRRYRIRLCDIGEYPEETSIPVGYEEYTLVQKLAPGLQARQFFALKGTLTASCDECWPSDEAILDFLNHIIPGG